LLSRWPAQRLDEKGLSNNTVRWIWGCCHGRNSTQHGGSSCHCCSGCPGSRTSVKCMKNTPHCRH